MEKWRKDCQQRIALAVLQQHSTARQLRHGSAAEEAHPPLLGPHLRFHQIEEVDHGSRRQIAKRMELPSRNYDEVTLGQFHRLRNPSNLQPASALDNDVKNGAIPLDADSPGGPEFGPKSDGALEPNAPQEVGKQVSAQRTRTPPSRYANAVTTPPLAHPTIGHSSESCTTCKKIVNNLISPETPLGCSDNCQCQDRTRTKVIRCTRCLKFTWAPNSGVGVKGLP
jgi:hypothetical protein